MTPPSPPWFTTGPAGYPRIVASRQVPLRLVGVALLALAVALGIDRAPFGAAMVVVLGAPPFLLSFAWVEPRPDCIATRYGLVTRTIPWSQVASVDVHRHRALRLVAAYRTTGGALHLSQPMYYAGCNSSAFDAALAYMQQCHLAFGANRPADPSLVGR